MARKRQESQKLYGVGLQVKLIYLGVGPKQHNKCANDSFGL